MKNLDLATLRAHKALARQDYEKQAAGAVGPGNDFSSAGPPTWSREAYEACTRMHGYPPFGRVNGTMVRPPTMAGAPDWVYEVMGERRPPVSVNAGENLWNN